MGGRFVAPRLANLQAAVSSAAIPAILGRYEALPLHSTAASAYPLSSLIMADSCQGATVTESDAATTAFLAGILGTGQSALTVVSYAPLPSTLQQAAQNSLEAVSTTPSANPTPPVLTATATPAT